MTLLAFVADSTREWPKSTVYCCRLSKKTKFDKRIAVTVFSFPPDKGNVGTAAYLNVFGSIHKVLNVSQLLLITLHYAWVLTRRCCTLVCCSRAAGSRHLMGTLSNP